MRPDGLIELPDGSAIFYDDPSHAYYRAVAEGFREPELGETPETVWRRSTRLTGASTLSKPFNFDADKLLAWKERMTADGIAGLVALESPAKTPGWLYTQRSILDKLKEAKVGADDVRDRKAALGTSVHRVLEGLAGVCPMPNVDELPEDEKGYARAVMRWWEDRRPRVLQAEQFVYSAKHGYAGRFDLRADIRGSGDADDGPWIALIDLKTSSYISPAYHVQLALYELAARECGVGGSDEQYVLQVRPDGTWREVRSKATEADALAAIEVYRGEARIKREAKAAA